MTRERLKDINKELKRADLTKIELLRITHELIGAVIEHPEILKKEAELKKEQTA